MYIPVKVTNASPKEHFVYVVVDIYKVGVDMFGNKKETYFDSKEFKVSLKGLSERSGYNDGYTTGLEPNSCYTFSISKASCQ